MGDIVISTYFLTILSHQKTTSRGYSVFVSKKMEWFSGKGTTQSQLTKTLTTLATLREKITSTFIRIQGRRTCDGGRAFVEP